VCATRPLQRPRIKNNILFKGKKSLKKQHIKIRRAFLLTITRLNALAFSLVNHAIEKYFNLIVWTVVVL
jgi:hypothetical protein